MQAGYNLGSQEMIILFLKGFEKNRGMLNKLFSPLILVTYEAMKRRAISIVKSIQLMNAIVQNAPGFNQFCFGQRPPQQQSCPWVPQPPQPNRNYTPP